VKNLALITLDYVTSDEVKVFQSIDGTGKHCPDGKSNVHANGLPDMLTPAHTKAVKSPKRAAKGFIENYTCSLVH
jgi:hypothetical protein